MNISRKITAILLFTMGLISIAMRYPNINGEHGNDGMGVHWLANVIVINGYNPLILDPLSYFGMYPFSSPFAVQTLLATIHLVTGVEISTIVLFIGHAFGLYGIAMAFMLGKAFNKKNQFAIAAVLLYITSFYFIDYTFWQISTRGPFMALFITLVFLLFRFEVTGKKRYVFMLILQYIILMATHRMVAFVIPTIFVPYVIYKLYCYLKTKIEISNTLPRKYHNPIFAAVIAIPFIMSVYFPELFSLMGLTLEPLWIKERFNIFVISKILNIAFTYVSLNILLLFSVIGVVYLVSKEKRQSKETLLLTMLPIQGIFIINYEYFMPIFMPFLSLLGAAGIIQFARYVNNKHPGTSIKCLIIIILIAVPYTAFVRELNTNISAERGNHPEIEGFGIAQETRNTAFWIENSIKITDRTIDNNPKSYQLITITEMRIMEDVDIVMTHQDGELKEAITIQQFPFFDIFFNQRGYHYGGNVEDWFGTYDRINSGYHIFNVHLNGRDFRLVQAYEIKYIIECAENSGHYREWDSKLLIEATGLDYVTYRNELWVIYFFRNDY